MTPSPRGAAARTWCEFHPGLVGLSRVRRREIAGASRVGLLALLGLSACSSKELATRWVPADAAMVRCTEAGRTRMPPVLLELPVPALPTGLLARQLDPMALNDMGYERQQPVCAALLTPEPATIDEARGQVGALLSLHKEIGANAKAQLGNCACEVARRAEIAELVGSCRHEPHRAECSPSAEDVEELEQLIAPLQEALKATPVPRVHWRVAGRSDRPGWMVERLPELVARHSGGVTSYPAGQAVPSRHNHVLVRRLLEVPGVTAVLRLDGGRSIAVIREIEGAMVIDLLSFPKVDPKLVPLLPHIDAARAEAVAQSLAAPESAWTPPLPLSEGNLVHLDRVALRAVDSLVLAMAPLAGVRDAPGRLPEPTDPWRMDTITLQAKFGTKGRVLRTRVGLSEAGKEWAQTLSNSLLAHQIDALGLPEQGRTFPPALGVSLPFIVHETATARLVFGGLSHAPALMERLEMHHPGVIGGTLDAWDVDLPVGAVVPGGTVAPPLELRAWAERVGSEPHRVRSSFDPPREVLEITLEPD